MNTSKNTLTTSLFIALITTSALAMDSEIPEFPTSPRSNHFSGPINASGGVNLPGANIHTGPEYYVHSSNNSDAPFTDQLLTAMKQGYIQLLAGLAVQVPIEIIKAVVAHRAANQSTENSDPQDQLFCDMIEIKTLSKLVSTLEEELKKQDSQEAPQPFDEEASEQAAQTKADIRKNIAEVRRHLLQKMKSASEHLQEEVSPAVAI